MTKIDVTDSMIAEAMDIGSRTGLFVQNPKRSDVVKLIQSVLSLVRAQGPDRFNCRVRDVSGTHVRARIIGPAPEQRGFFRVETEHGKQLFLSGNEIYPYSSYKPGR